MGKCLISTLFFYSPKLLEGCNIIKKKGSGKHFHNVLCLSEVKGMDIIMKKAKFIPGCVFLTAAMLSLVACGADKELPDDSNYITQSSGVDFDGGGIADHLYI